MSARTDGEGPLVSVIVPMFNAGATVERCLASLDAGGLEGDAWECVVVNDGSSDEGPRIAGAFAARDARVRVVHQANRGLPAARNAGIERARGAWLRFLDADDWVLPGGLAELVETARRSGDATLGVCGAARYVSEAGEDLGWSFTPGVERVTAAMLVEGHRFQVGASMVRCAALGPERFACDAEGSEDLDLWLRLGSKRGMTWAATQRDVSAYRLRAGGMSRDHTMMAKAAARVVSRALERGVPGVLDAEAARARCVRRIGAERAAALALHGASAGLGLWREVRVGGVMRAEEAASAAHWSVPYADCRAPTAWAELGHARRYAEAVSAWWRLMERAGEAESGAESRVIGALARRLVPAERVAGEIVAALGALAVRRAVLFGLGRNARVLIPALARLGVEVLGTDDAWHAGEVVETEGARVPVVGAAEVGSLARGGAALVLTTVGAAGLETRFNAMIRGAEAEAGGRGPIWIKWGRFSDDVSGREQRRLAALWPRVVHGAGSGVQQREAAA